MPPLSRPTRFPGPAPGAHRRGSGDRRADHVGRHAPLAGAQQHDGGRRAPQAVRHLHRPDAGLYAGRGRRDGLPAQRADAVRHEQP
ncbi:hypothetical protein G6F65_023306 [Rhizopus arrhizus]|nr:hypothetical protein G6F65_023306 [Rhizopus arrhizus]